jgi:hypothetical protein
LGDQDLGQATPGVVGHDRHVVEVEGLEELVDQLGQAGRAQVGPPGGG